MCRGREYMEAVFFAQFIFVNLKPLLKKCIKQIFQESMHR